MEAMVEADQSFPNFTLLTKSVRGFGLGSGTLRSPVRIANASCSRMLRLGMGQLPIQLAHSGTECVT